MAQEEEPMDVDSSVCEFDNKENAYLHGNLLPRTPCTEKGYEELDVTELNMKLRYSITPVASPMSKSLTANIDNRTFDGGDENAENNMTLSLNSTFNKNEKLAKSLPLQTLTTEPHLDGSRSILRPLDSTVTFDNNITVTVSTPNENDDLSIPSYTSSLAHTPEVTTPTKDNLKDEASPILRGLKSVLNMFRPSQSPIPPEEQNALAEALSPPIVCSPKLTDTQSVLVSTPLAARNTSDMLTKRTTPIKENIVFKEDLEKELQWKDESTIIFEDEKVPLHKLFFQNVKPQATPVASTDKPAEPKHDVNTSVEYMDISCNESMTDKTLNVEAQPRVDKNETLVESDSEFVDCETTINKNETLFSADTSLDSYISMDVNLDSTKAIVEKLTSLSNDTVNASSDTLEASTKTADLSNVSVETAEPNDITLEINDQLSGDIGINRSVDNHQMHQIETKNSEPNNRTIQICQVSGEAINYLQKKQEAITNLEEIAVNKQTPISAEEEHVDEAEKNTEDEALNAAQVSLSFAESSETYDSSPIISHPVKYPVKTPAIHNVVVENTIPNLVDNEVGSPTVDKDSIVLNSLAHIPLIADPRVLLFNISSEMLVESVNIQMVNPESQPADVPLPDEDEIASLPPFVPTITEQDVPPSFVEQDDALASKLIEVVDKHVIHSSEVGTVTENHASEVVVAKEVADQTIFTQQSVIKPEDIAVPVSEAKDIPTQQPFIEIKENTNTHLISDANDLVDALEVVAQASMAPLIQNLLELGTTTTEVTKVEDIASFPEFNQTMSDYTSMPDVIVTSEKENETEFASLQVSAKLDISMKPDDIVADVKLDDVTPKPESIVEYGNASDHLVESKQLSIDIPQSPKPENYVAPVSDLVIEGSVQETPSDSQFTQEHDLSKSNIQEHIIKTIPASVVAKLNESLDKKEFETRKTDVNLMESQNFSSSKATELRSGDAQMSINKDIVETNIASNEEKVLVENFPDVNTQDNNMTDAPNENKIVLDPVPVQERDLKLLQSDILLSNDQKQVKNTKIFPQRETNVVVDNLDSDVSIVDLDSKAIETICASVQSPEIPKVDHVDANDQYPISDTPFETKENIDEEIVASENNSPFVSVSAEINSKVEQVSAQISEFPQKSVLLHCLDNEVESKPIENSEEINKTAPKVVTPPKSPPIVSKGYNFSFDDIEDPFATKTKIRQSPPLETAPNQTFSHLDDTLPVAESPKKDSNINRPYPQKRKPIRVNHKLNTNPGSAAVDKDKKTTGKSNASPSRDCSESVKTKSILEIKEGENTDLNIAVKREATADEFKDLANSKDPINSTNKVITSVKSTEEINIPEIDDLDFNPFATKTKIRQSPPPSLDGTFNKDNISTNTFNLPEMDDPNFNPFATKTKIQKSPPPSLDGTLVTYSPTKTETRKDDLKTANLSPITGRLGKEVDSFDNSTDVQCLSKSSTMGTASSVKTEDQDTIEGPFLDDIEFNDDDKISDFDGDNVGMIEFGDIPPENADNAEGEMFIDAEAFEFLLNQNQTSTVTDSGKESLFLKFDPLFAKRLSAAGVSHPLNSIQKRHVTPKAGGKSPQQSLVSIETPQKDSTFVATLQKDATFVGTPLKDATFTEILQKDATFVATPQKDATFVATPQKDAIFVSMPEKDVTFTETLQKDATMIDALQQKPTVTAPVQQNVTFSGSSVAGPSKLNATNDTDASTGTEESSEDLNATIVKPMMVVNPAVNPIGTPKVKATTPNRRSLTFASPAIAVIDRLLSISANNSMLGHDTSVRGSQDNQEANQALTQLRELLADKEIDVHNLRTESKDLRERLGNLESQMKQLATISQERLKNINELNAKLDEKTKHNKSMAQVVEEYERTIASLITQLEEDKKRHAEERLLLIREREEATSHLTSMEISFSDLHSKYEKSKQVIFGFKANEESLKKSVKEFEENLAKMQANYETLKQHATAKLNHANDELQKLNRAHEVEVLKLNAMIKRKEVDITSLEESLAQKNKTNQDLTGICDSLLAKFN